MKLQSKYTVLENGIGHKLHLHQHRKQDGTFAGTVHGCLSGQDLDIVNKFLLSGCKVGDKLNTQQFNEVPPVFKLDTDTVADINVYTVKSIEIVDLI